MRRKKGKHVSARGALSKRVARGQQSQETRTPAEVLVLSALPEDDPEAHIAGRIAGTLNVAPSSVTVTIATEAPALLQASRSGERCVAEYGSS